MINISEKSVLLYSLDDLSIDVVCSIVQGNLKNYITDLVNFFTTKKLKSSQVIQAYIKAENRKT